MRGREEHITFSLPRELVRLARGQQVAG